MLKFLAEVLKLPPMERIPVMETVIFFPSAEADEAAWGRPVDLGAISSRNVKDYPDKGVVAS